MRVGEVIARTVRAERTARSWTQAELSERSGLSPQVVSALERGRHRVTADDLVPLCRALGMTLPELLARVDPDDRRVLGL